MNIHIGSWIVPALFTLFFLPWTLVQIAKVRDKLTIEQARRSANWTPDEAVQAAVGFALLCRWAVLSLGGWIIWAIVFLNFGA